MLTLNHFPVWEEHFIQEYLELEELMKTLDIYSLERSKLRLCIENKILTWKDYENWLTQNIGCSFISAEANFLDFERFVDTISENLNTYSDFQYWNEDLLPLNIWDNQLIVLGIQYSEKLLSLPNIIFILTPPKILTYLNIQIEKRKQMNQIPQNQNLTENEFNFKAEVLTENLSEKTVLINEKLNSSSLNHEANSKEQPFESDNEKSKTFFPIPDELSPELDDEKTQILLEPISSSDEEMSEKTSILSINTHLSTTHSLFPTYEENFELKSNNQTESFVSTTASPTKSHSTSIKSDLQMEPNESADQKIWEIISDRHQENSFEAKKLFDALFVLKVYQNKTTLFKADEQFKDIDPKKFEFDLNKIGPFKTIYKNGVSSTYNLNQLGLKLDGFQFACVTPLKRGHQIVGFFIGIKKENLITSDQTFLEELAKETAA